MKKFTLIILCFIAIAAMMSNRANAANDGDSDVMLTAVVQSTNDVSKIPVTIYLTNPSTEIKAIEAVLEAPVAVDKFDNIAYSNTDRWNSMAEIQMAAGTENHGANGFFISILNWTGDRLTDPYAQITECSGTEGPIITVYFDGSELADGNYTVRMYDAFAVASGSSSIDSPDANIEFSIQNGKVIGTNGGSTSTLATDISLDHETLSMNIGESQKLSASIIPSEAWQDVTWTSSDTKVATVSQNGIVTAIAEGQTIIAATTTDGSNIKGYCTVSVYNYNSDGLCYRFESGIYEGQTAYVVKSETATGDIVIPDILEGPSGPYGSMYDVVGIDDGAFAGCTGITSITSPTIGFSAAAFTGCTGLQKIIVDDNVRYVRSEDNNCLVNNDATELFLGFDNTVIPNSVTKIGYNAFFGCTGLTSITIPSTVTSIGIGAFEGCTGLTSIKIPTSVTSIGVAAFRGCTRVTSINIPESITKLGHSTFYGCTGLTSINIPELTTTIPSYTFYGCTSLTSIEIPNAVTTIDNSAFNGCTGLTSIEIPNSVTAIGNSAFEGCTDLSSATLGNSVTTIGNSAFKNCSSLASINIPASVTSFGNGIFEGCTSLPVQDGIRYADNYIVEIVDKDRTTYSIKEGTRVVNMEGCANMVSIDLPNSVTEINFKGCTNLASVTIPNSVTSIRDNAFQGCTGLMSVTIPNSVKNIGSYAFNGCTSLTSITIPNSVTTMGHNVFSGCTGLSSISLSEALTSVIHYAFRNCTGLTSIMIPKSVTDIEPDAFSGCTNLTSMEVMGEEPYQLGGEESIFGDIFYYPAFDDYGRVDLIVPLGCAEKFRNAEHWKDFRSIREKVIDSDFSYVMDEENDNAAVYGTSDKDATEVEIPSTVENDGKVYAVTQIAANAFANYDNLEQILIPDDVTTVGNAAFEDCNSLEYVVLPAKMEEIGDKAFEGCSSITEIRTLSPTPPAISEGTFSEETMRTATLYVPMGCVVVYENAPYWGRFAYISEKDMSDDVTTISDVSADSQATVVGIYTPSGSRLNADSVGGLGKGIYIFRYNDGKSEKVVVK